MISCTYGKAAVVFVNRDVILGPIRRLAAHSWLGPAAVFTLALLPRISLALYLPAAVLWPDGQRYMLVAGNLLAGHGFGSLADNQLSVPTQPLLLAGVIWVFGHSFVTLRCFFAVLGAATCVLAFALAKRLFGPVVAVIAGLALAIYPHYIYLSALFEYPQTFFIFVMAVSFIYFFDFLCSQRPWPLAAAGFSLGLGILSVPTAILFAPALPLCMWVGRVKRLVVCTIILATAAAIPVGAWTASNYLRYGQLILVNQAGGVNFWVANNETYYQFGKRAIAPPCGPGYEDTSFCIETRELHWRLKSQGLTQNQIISLEEKAAWHGGMEFLRASPGRFARLMVTKFLRFWDPRPDAVHSGGAYGGRASSWLAVISYLPVLILGLVGLYRSRGRWRELLPIYAYFGVWTTVYSVFLPTTRYRLPLDFFLIIFSAYTLTLLVPGLSSRREDRPPAIEPNAA